MLSKKDYESEAYIYKIIMHLNGFASLISSTLAIYMILYKSTAMMGSYKWYLLNIVLWSAALDIYLGLFYTPFLVFPANGVCAQGFLSSFDDHNFQQFEFLFFIWLIGGLEVSLICGFVYRLAAVTESVHKLNHHQTLVTIVLIHILYTLPVIIPVLYSASYDYKLVLQDIKTRHSFIYELGLEQSCLYTSSHVTPISSLLYRVLAVVLTFVCIITSTALIFVIMKVIGHKQFNVSTRALSMHKQMTISLIAQFTLPTVFVAIPFLVLASLSLMDRLDNVWARMAGAGLFVVGSMHSTLNAIALIAITRPYREALLKNFLPHRLHPEPSTVVVVNHLSTAYNGTRLHRSTRTFGNRMIKK